MILNPYAIVIDVYATLGGKQPGATSYADHKAYINANGQAKYLTALEGMFAAQTNATMSATILGHLGLASVFTAAQGEAYLAANAGNRVKAALDLASALTNYVSDATNTNDAAILAAKTTYVATTANAYTYASNAANTADAATSSAAVSTGKTFTLTTSVDNFVGGAGDDVITGFIGTGATYSAADVINGGAGNNTLRIFSDNTSTIGEISNIQNLYISDSVHDSVNIATGNLAAVSNLTLKSGVNVDGATITVTQGDGDSLTLDAVQDVGDGAATVADGGFSIAQAATLSSTALTLKDTGAATANTATTVGLAGTGVTTLNLTSSGTANHANLLNAGGALTTVNIDGAGALTLYTDLATTVTTVNAATATGALTLMLDGTAVRTVTGGTGADKFVMAAGYIGGTTGATRDIINGGEGTDTVSITTAIGAAIAAAQSNLTSIETIAVSNASAAINLTYFTGATKLVLEAGKTAAATTVTVNSGTTVQLKADAGNEDHTFTVTGTGTNDTMTLVLDSGVDFLGTTGTADTFTGIETLNIQTQSTPNAGTVNIFADATTMTATASTETMNISGKTAITFTGVVTADAINGSGLVGSSAVLTLTGGTASAAVITGGEAADLLLGSSSADIISGGGGADIITTSGGTDTLTGGAGADIFLLNGDDQGNVITDFTAGTGGDIFRYDDSSITASTNAGGINSAFIGTDALAFKAISAGITAAAATDNVLVVQTAVAGTSAAAVEDAVLLAGGGAGNFGATSVSYVIFNSTTAKGEIWLDAAGGTDNNGTGVILMATLDNITTLVGVQALVAGNFDVQA